MTSVNVARVPQLGRLLANIRYLSALNGSQLAKMKKSTPDMSLP